MLNKQTAEHYMWGQGCDGWYLAKSAELTIIEERMPPGTAEIRHKHRKSTQFFYIVSGVATMQHDCHETTLRAGDCLEIAPEVSHRISNDGNTDLEFIVISKPPSHDDRIDLP